MVGKHIYGNLYGVDPNLLMDEQFLKKLVIEAAILANTKVVDVKSWKLIGGDKYGISVIALVIESHIAIHTWPKYRFATVDVYTCGAQSEPEKAFDYIVQKLKPKFYTKNYVDRSCVESKQVLQA